jgi:putative DNA primase/helicase
MIDWGRRASADPTRILEWWATWPEANVGLPTGARNDIVVLDVDPGRGGRESLRRLQERYGPLPTTVVHLTGGGGEHLLFRHPGRRVPSACDALGPGIDVRADGGLIVAPPSLHASGKEYTSHPAYGLGLVDVAPMPGWLVALLAGPGRGPGSPTPSPRAGARFRWPEVLDGVHEGRRHTSIFLMASSLRGQGVPEAVARELALVAARRCRPRFPESEALAIVDDVYERYSVGAARGRALSGERLDVLAVLSTAARPLRPVDVAVSLAKERGAVKKLMAAMANDGQTRRVQGGYILGLQSARAGGEAREQSNRIEWQPAAAVGA